MIKNFILFNPDELRAEALGCYGNPAAKTPNIDKLARNAVRFDQCHVQHPVCTPSRCSFATGLYPHNGGHRSLWNVLDEDEPHLFQYLKDAGVEVHWWGKNDMLSQKAAENCLDSVNAFSNEKGAKIYQFFSKLRPKPLCDEDKNDSFLYETDLETIDGHPDYICVDAAIDYIKSMPENPFCIFLPLFLPHPPYCVTKDYEDAIDKDNIPALRPITEGKPDFYSLIREYRNLDKLSDDDFREINKVYLAQTAMIDTMVGKLLEALEETGAMDETAFIFFSDHGDWAGDYGLVEKWPSAMDDTITRVPLIIKTPDCKSGHTVQEPVELFDIMATVMDLAGIKEKHSHFAQSLKPQLMGACGDKNRAVFAEGGYDAHEPQCFEGSDFEYDIAKNADMNVYYKKGLQQQERPESVCRAVMMRTTAHKLIVRPGGQSEFYELEKDPLELYNKYEDSSKKDVIGKMEKQLLDWYIHTSDTVPFVRQSRNFSQETSARINDKRK